MGASAWDYFVPYQPDIEKALRELRERVFRSGDYYKRPPLEINPDDYADMPEEVREQVPAWIEREKSLSEPATIDALIEWNGEEGTHSIISRSRVCSDDFSHRRQKATEVATTSRFRDLLIIDIERISSIPAFGTAAPLSREQLIELFGTGKPERRMVEQKAREIQSLRDRWEATYIVVYKDDMPDEIFFAGYSGD